MRQVRHFVHATVGLDEDTQALEVASAGTHGRAVVIAARGDNRGGEYHCNDRCNAAPALSHLLRDTDDSDDQQQESARIVSQAESNERVLRGRRANHLF